MQIMTKTETLLAGLGIGLLAAAFLIKVVGLMWVVVALGPVFLIVAGLGLLRVKKSTKNK